MHNDITHSSSYSQDKTLVMQLCIIIRRLSVPAKSDGRPCHGPWGKTSPQLLSTQPPGLSRKGAYRTRRKEKIGICATGIPPSVDDQASFLDATPQSSVGSRRSSGAP